jgi:biotin synthase-like enzyme
MSILEKHGDKLLTTNNPDLTDDTDLLNRLGIEPLAPSHLNANGSDHPVL